MKISDFVKFTTNGVVTANFNEILSSLAEEYKKIYGSDIDLSNGTADGEYLWSVANMINSLVESVKLTNSNLNLDSASGTYLDNLCKLSNVYRRQKSASIAYLKLSALTSKITVNYSQLKFVDQSQNEWSPTIKSGSLTIPVMNDYVTVEVSCDTLGAIKAPAGWINKSVVDLDISIIQDEDAILGREEETDSQLRARQNQSSGSTGMTVLDDMLGNILSVPDVIDVYIVSNEGDSILSYDNFSVNPHSILPVVRRRVKTDQNKRDIGAKIFSTLTPGIATNKIMSGSAQVTNEYVRSYMFDNVTVISSLKNSIYWLDSPIKSGVTLTLKFKKNSTYDEDKCNETLAPVLLNYLESLRMGSKFTIGNISSVLTQYDISLNGSSSFYLDFQSSNIKVSNAVVSVCNMGVRHFEISTVQFKSDFTSEDGTIEVVFKS